ncbi:glycoside hydrolase family 3 N-terminal domain-containing protein [Protaetiibacter intestinalis]|uniref:Glycoside hydrolase family 3 protein n=1 Tax=Protaetiibacter intestinalis TaxID=2419774 RepID=A0A387B751_9MICO|nr:glycoside hydrolase family 3 N-terminal domain-containing protein [Protaetiibacter intestinalis]AYF96896.1 glycoside hydrolase family 3 protein [Protaetiibacter intestinalis]
MRRPAAVLAAALAVAALAGCAPQATPVSAAPPRAWAPAVAPQPVDPGAAYLTARLADMTTLQLAESVIMPRIPSTDPAAARAAVAASGVGGVILMGGDTQYSVDVARALTTALTTDPGLPPLTAVDQEGGTVARLDDPGPSARALGRMPPEATRQAFADRARLVASAGFDLNFGIVADVTGDPGSFLAPRVFGGDPAAVADRVAAAVAGESGIVLSTLKHFPGHGGAPGDSHHLIPETAMSLDEWRATQAPPFRAGIDAGAELVMVGHLRYTAVDAAPASLSPTWYRILRDELGFDGVIVTDSLSMLQDSGDPAYADPAANGLAALAAGADLLLYAGPVDTTAVAQRIADAVADGTLPPERLRDAAERVMQLRRSVASSDAPYVRCRAACAAAVG